MADTNQVGGDFRQQLATFDNPGSRIITVSYETFLVMETDLGTYKCVCLQEFRKYRRNESTKSNLISSLVNILAPYPGKGWRVAATGKVDKLEHEDLWALNLDMGNWNNETWHELKNYADQGVSFAPRLNNPSSRKIRILQRYLV